jgi:DNA polymerase III gamma/tau subunit
MFFELDLAFHKKDLPFAFTLAKEIFSGGKDLIYFFECLLEHYRTLLTCKLSIGSEELFAAKQVKYAQSALYYTEQQILYILDYLMQWHEQASKTPFKRVLLEMVLLHILRSKQRICATDLVLRLEALSSSHPIKPPEKPPQDPIAVLQSAPPVKETVSPKKDPPPAAPLTTPSVTPSAPKSFQIQNDTLMRFASVELEGTLTKE